MKKEPDKDTNGFYYWQSAYSDAKDKSSMLNGFIYEKLSNFNKEDKSCLCRYYINKRMAMDDYYFTTKNLLKEVINSGVPSLYVKAYGKILEDFLITFETG